MAHPAAIRWTAVALAACSGLAGGSGGSATRRSRALVLALAAALLLLTRPIEAAALGAAVAAEALIARPRGRLGLIALAAGLAAGGALLALDHARLTGSPLVPPATRYFDTHVHPGANRLGFGPDIGLTWDGSPPGHSPLEALWNLRLNLEQLGRHLLGWPAGSLAWSTCWRRGRAARLLPACRCCPHPLWILATGWPSGRASAAPCPASPPCGAGPAVEDAARARLGEGWCRRRWGSRSRWIALIFRAGGRIPGLGMDGHLLRQASATPSALALIGSPLARLCGRLLSQR
jgi:hypothetical protein